VLVTDDADDGASRSRGVVEGRAVVNQVARGGEVLPLVSLDLLARPCPRTHLLGLDGRPRDGHTDDALPADTVQLEPPVLAGNGLREECPHARVLDHGHQSAVVLRRVAVLATFEVLQEGAQVASSGNHNPKDDATGPATGPPPKADNPPLDRHIVLTSRPRRFKGLAGLVMP